MKIVSEVTGKVYNTGDLEADCLLCEKEDNEEIARREEKAKAEKGKAENASKIKKELCGKIDDAQLQIDKAYEEYDKAKEKAQEILEKSNKEVEELLSTAKQNIVKAERDKYNAIAEFNSKFGPYKKVLTGSDAEKEFDRACEYSLYGDSILSLFNLLSN